MTRVKNDINKSIRFNIFMRKSFLERLDYFLTAKIDLEL